MWPDTLFISPVPNIRFLFFQSCLLSSLSAKQLLPFFFSAGAAPILISICGYWKRRLFFNWPTFVTRCCCQKKTGAHFQNSRSGLWELCFSISKCIFCTEIFSVGAKTSYLAQNYSSRDLDVNKKVFQSRPHKRNSKGIFKRLHLDFFERLECAREE